MVFSVLGLRRRTSVSNNNSQSDVDVDSDAKGRYKDEESDHVKNVSTLASDTTLVDAVDDEEDDNDDGDDDGEEVDDSRRLDKGKEKEIDSKPGPNSSINPIPPSRIRSRPRPRPQPRSTQVDPDSESTSFGYDLSIVIALVSPIGNWLTGGDHVKNVLLMLLLIFYLHQVIEVPWSLYVLSIPRHSPGKEELESRAYTSLTTLSTIYLILSILSPFLGASLLQIVAASITGSEHSLSWFSTALFVLATGVRPWRHLIHRLRGKSGALQEILDSQNQNHNHNHRRGRHNRISNSDSDSDSDSEIDSLTQQSIRTLQTNLTHLTTQLNILTNQISSIQRSSSEHQIHISEIELQMGELVGVVERSVAVERVRRMRMKRVRKSNANVNLLSFVLSWGDWVMRVFYRFGYLLLGLWDGFVGFLCLWGLSRRRKRNWMVKRKWNRIRVGDGDSFSSTEDDDDDDDDDDDNLDSNEDQNDYINYSDGTSNKIPSKSSSSSKSKSKSSHPPNSSPFEKVKSNTTTYIDRNNRSDSFSKDKSLGINNTTLSTVITPVSVPYRRSSRLSSSSLREINVDANSKFKSKSNNRQVSPQTPTLSLNLSSCARLDSIPEVEERVEEPSVACDPDDEDDVFKMVDGNTKLKLKLKLEGEVGDLDAADVRLQRIISMPLLSSSSLSSSSSSSSLSTIIPTTTTESNSIHNRPTGNPDSNHEIDFKSQDLSSGLSSQSHKSHMSRLHPPSQSQSQSQTQPQQFYTYRTPTRNLPISLLSTLSSATYTLLTFFRVYISFALVVLLKPVWILVGGVKWTSRR